LIKGWISAQPKLKRIQNQQSDPSSLTDLLRKRSKNFSITDQRTVGDLDASSLIRKQDQKRPHKRVA